MIDIRHVANMIAPDQIFETAGPSRAVQVSMKRQSTGSDFTQAALFIVSDAEQALLMELICM